MVAAEGMITNGEGKAAENWRLRRVASFCHGDDFMTPGGEKSGMQAGHCYRRT